MGYKGEIRIGFLFFIFLFLQFFTPTIAEAQVNNPTDTKEVKTVSENVYNNPNHTFWGFDCNGITQVPTVAGGSPLLGLHAKAFFTPKAFIYVAAHVQGFTSLGLSTDEKSAFESSAQVEFALLPFKKEKVKFITYQTSEKGLMYTWQYPIKRNFRFGFIAGANRGKRYIQTGSDEFTAITWGNANNPNGNKLSLPETFSEASAGLALMTTAWSKSSILLPNGKQVFKRYKALTMVSLSYVHLLADSYDNSMQIRSKGGIRDYFPMVTSSKQRGLKLQGDFRRKWLSLKIEAGISTGPNYRFSESERASFLNRSYFGLGFGFGWM